MHELQFIVLLPSVHWLTTLLLVTACHPKLYVNRDDVLQLWPLVSLINYKYVPLKLRVLVMQAIAFFW